MGTVKIWTGTAWQTASQAVSGGSAASPAWVGPDAPTGTPKTGDLWYDSDDTNVLTLPVSVAQGGTGQVTPAGARGALAVPAIGNSLTTAGAPTTGTFARGDIWLDSNNVRWMCTAAGTPGTWANMNIGEELAYNQITADFVVTTTSPSLVIEGTSRSYDGSPVLIEFYCSAIINAANQCLIGLWDGTTDLGYLTNNNFSGTTGNQGLANYAKRRLVPTQGTHNYRIVSWITVGSSSIRAGVGSGVSIPQPAYIRVTRA